MPGGGGTTRPGVKLPIASKLSLSFLVVIVFMSVVFVVVGVQLVANRVVSEAQEKVRNDLNVAREIKQSKLNHVNDVVSLTAGRFFLREALLAGGVAQTADELVKVRYQEGLDVLTITDSRGRVLLRSSNQGELGDDQSHDDLVAAVLATQARAAATCIVAADDLRKESPDLALQAHFQFIDTPKARPRSETEEKAGMMLKAAAPIFDPQGRLIGVLYGGVLLNRNFEIVDKIKQTVYQDVQYKGRDIGTSTIFQDDVRIATNVRNADGTRAIRTRVSEEVYNRVVGEGEPWIGRAYVVNHWYITAYEPIRNIRGQVIGILYVGIIEQKYNDVRTRTVSAFTGIAMGGAAVSMALSYLISRPIRQSIAKLVAASRAVAQGNLDAKVEITTNDELQELADTFNAMASAVKARDERLKEYASSRVRKSERLAMVGQLAAGVAHELNNPMQGIVTYSLLLLEEMPADDPNRSAIETIVKQANRCTEIVRGLLDFSRRKTPHKQRFDAVRVLEECITLVERQSLFHNIEIVRSFQAGLPPVVIDPTQIQQVFMNLIMNAAEAMEGSGRLYLATRLQPGGQNVEVEVTDTGHGISEADMEKVFVPFFTTKESGHGVGLGLAISYGIVKEHKGTISVESEPEKGTTFIVRLPVTAEEGEAEDGR